MELDHDACYQALASRDARFDGRLFAGVRTTGIYCRPICPARTPRPENVSFFASAAAAQAAGFRPCLRCRPECAPELAAWRGSSNTISRALTLIAEGGLDEAPVGRLAERLGMGERHLRRLFRTHLGVTPIAIAQTRRVLFARQLIVGTDLALTEIALAAGFSSLRRFNATFRALYGRPPGLFRREAGGKPLPGETGIRLSLPYARPYDWPAMLAFLEKRAIAGVEAIDGRQRYCRTIALGGRSGWIAVGHNEKEGCLEATIRFPEITALAPIVAALRRIFDLGADPLAIASHLGRDPVLAPLVGRRPGLRVPGAWDGFELAVRAVLGQQITVEAANRLAGRLVGLYGEKAAECGPAGLSHLFPGPGRLVELKAEALGIPASRAAALVALARAALGDPGLFSPSPSPSPAAAVARLAALPGIGAWTAQYIAMRAFREPDAFPAADAGLLRAMARLDGVRPDAAGLEARSLAWRPWRAYAALHLWTADAGGIACDDKKGDKR